MIQYDSEEDFINSLENPMPYKRAIGLFDKLCAAIKKGTMWDCFDKSFHFTFDLNTTLRYPDNSLQMIHIEILDWCDLFISQNEAGTKVGIYLEKNDMILKQDDLSIDRTIF